MTNPSKAKGYRWEKEAVEVLNAMYPGVWKRMPGSGAFGTVMELKKLTGDLVGDYPFLPFIIRAENKVGYGGKEMTVKKEWFDKIRQETEQNLNEVPCVLIKFEHSRSGVRYIIAFDFDAWQKLLESIEELQQENVTLRKIIDERLSESRENN